MKAFTLLLLTVACTYASPLPLPLHHPRGTPGGVYFCSGPNWTISCWWQYYPWHLCVNFGDDSVGIFDSFGPDQGGTCAIFDQPNCEGNQLATTYPGYANLTANGWSVGRPKSYICYPNEDD